jgi:hypothetical protein
MNIWSHRLLKAYDFLRHEGYQHLSINRSINFIAVKTGAYTQTLESQWRVPRLRLQRRCVRGNNLDYHLYEYLCRREDKKKGHNLLIQK